MITIKKIIFTILSITSISGALAYTQVSNEPLNFDNSSNVKISSEAGYFYYEQTTESEETLSEGIFGVISPDGSFIVYSNVNDNGYLYKINTDGTNNTQLNSVNSVDPVISPDGSFIVYRNIDDGYKLYKINTDGTNNTQLNNSTSYDPVISPDGSFIVYINSDDGYKLYKINTDGTNNTQLNSVNSEGPVISPDGSFIVYINFDDGYKLYKINTDGTNNTQLNSVNSEDPVISPDGLFVVYKNNGDSGYLYKINTDGTNNTQLNNSTSSDPVISPDGSFIVYINNLDGNKLYKINTDGTNNTALNSVDSINPVISPDGSFMIYTYFDGNTFTDFLNKYTFSSTTLKNPVQNYDAPSDFANSEILFHYKDLDDNSEILSNLIVYDIINNSIINQYGNNQYYETNLDGFADLTDFGSENFFGFTEDYKFIKLTSDKYIQLFTNDFVPLSRANVETLIGENPDNIGWTSLDDVASITYKGGQGGDVFFILSNGTLKTCLANSNTCTITFAKGEQTFFCKVISEAGENFILFQNKYKTQNLFKNFLYEYKTSFKTFDSQENVVFDYNAGYELYLNPLTYPYSQIKIVDYINNNDNYCFIYTQESQVYEKCYSIESGDINAYTSLSNFYTSNKTTSPIDEGYSIFNGTTSITINNGTTEIVGSNQINIIDGKLLEYSFTYSGDNQEYTYNIAQGENDYLIYENGSSFYLYDVVTEEFQQISTFKIDISKIDSSNYDLLLTINNKTFLYTFEVNLQTGGSDVGYLNILNNTKYTFNYIGSGSYEFIDKQTNNTFSGNNRFICIKTDNSRYISNSYGCLYEMYNYSTSTYEIKEYSTYYEILGNGTPIFLFNKFTEENRQNATITSGLQGEYFNCSGLNPFECVGKVLIDVGTLVSSAITQPIENISNLGNDLKNIKYGACSNGGLFDMGKPGNSDNPATNAVANLNSPLFDFIKYFLLFGVGLGITFILFNDKKDE